MRSPHAIIIRHDPRPTAERRGIALLLVVVTLATATVLTTSFLLSRENTPDIGLTASQRASSDWSTRSAADLVQAIMETDVDWRTQANSGLMLEDYGFMGSLINVAVTDLNGESVDEDDRHVVVTVRGVNNGVESVVQRVLAVRPDGTYEQALDPQLSEFGVFAANAVDLKGSGVVTTWALSPSARAGEFAKMGIGFTGTSGFSVDPGSMPVGGKVFLSPDAGLGLESIVATHSKSTKLPTNVWTTTAERPASLQSPPLITPNDFTLEVDGTFLPGAYTGRVTIDDGATMTIDGANGPVLFGSTGASGHGLRLVDGSTLRIVGDVEMAVLNDLTIEDSVIELTDGATLTIYYDEDINIKDSIVGADPALLATDNRTAADLTTYTDPRRVRFIQLNDTPSLADDMAEISEHSIVVGSFHAPVARVRIHQDSVLAGRLSAGELTVENNGRVLLDPVFDNKMGLTEATSPLYDENGDLIPGLKDALEATSDGEGFSAALARILAALPPQTPAGATPDPDGASQRVGDRVVVLREWPVRAQSQERAPGEERLFMAPRNAAVAAKLGGLVEEALEEIKIAEGVAPVFVPAPVPKTPTIIEVITAAGGDDDD